MKYFSFLSLATTCLVFPADADFHPNRALETIPSPDVVSALMHLQTPRREAELDDLTDLIDIDQLFEDASFTLLEEEETITRDTLFGTATFGIQNLKCYDISVGDIELDYEVHHEKDIDVSIGLYEVHVTCEVDYRYEYGFIKGDGLARITTFNNSFATTVNLTSDGLGLEECTPNLQITDIDSEGDLLGDLLEELEEFFEQFTRDVIEEKVESMVCTELSRLARYVGDLVINMTEEAATLPKDANTDIDQTSYLMLVAGVTFALILAAIVVRLFVMFIVRRRQNKWLGSLPQRQLKYLLAEQNKNNALESSRNKNTQSMFTSPDVPLLVRGLMPLVILGNIAFFLSGHLSLGATVNIEGQVAGKAFARDNFFEFTMAKSVADMWNAGGHALAILLVIFSGVWPYSKQLITLFLWFVPPTRVSVSRRGTILLWLDALAKWSMIDIFVLVMSIAAFRISIVSPPVSWLPEDFYAVDLMVVPMWGLYANMIAQLLSQVSSHFIIHYHRRIVKAYEEKSVENGGVGSVKEVSVTNSPEKVSSHKFCRLHRCLREGLVVRTWVCPLLFVLGLCTVVMVVLGSSLPSFALEIYGILGIVVESGQGGDEAITYHSIFTVVELMFEQAKFLGTGRDLVGLGSLSVILVLTVLVVPIGQCLVLLFQWFSPLTTTQRTKLALAIEILQAWQYSEVYLIAIFIACWQLGSISEFMVGMYCDWLKDIFPLLVDLGIVKGEDAQCFSLQASIEDGFFFLLVGSVLLALINSFVNKAVVQYFRDMSDAQNRMLYDEIVAKDPEVSSETAEDDNELESKIDPVPVLFTDSFRWLLRQEDENLKSTDTSEENNDTKEGAIRDSAKG